MMKFVKISTKSLKLSPKSLLRSGSKEKKYTPSKSDPPSFGSGTTSSSSSTSDLKSGVAFVGVVTPTSVLPDRSGDLSDFSVDLHSELAEAFKLIDRDNDGIVSRKELEALLCRLAGGGVGSSTNQEVVATMLSEVDSDGEGCISVEALMSRVSSAAACEPAGDSDLREAFDFFDADRDGRITAEELFGFFTAIGDDRCTLDDCRRMIDGVDRNGDGFVCYEDFSRMMELQRF
ncbi:hypothetical protein TIFTF001_024594 [Ficus carica]|uniref:EF-hand domain-containing protein n=1 Tax=Ficus carica TaxID=3494 RepID=A0AA88AVX9_FICCA|nr:hypothetical protein TIFTF001_024594 [Ficus carica]